MANKRIEEICYWLRPKSAALGSAKTSFTTALICTICSCKFAAACGWHLWHCTKHDEDVSEQYSCNDCAEE